MMYDEKDRVKNLLKRAEKEKNDALVKTLEKRLAAYPADKK